jgi:hypothetical protein
MNGLQTVTATSFACIYLEGAPLAGDLVGCGVGGTREVGFGVSDFEFPESVAGVGSAEGLALRSCLWPLPHPVRKITAAKLRTTVTLRRFMASSFPV